jgi:hypothetical protein
MLRSIRSAKRGTNGGWPSSVPRSPKTRSRPEMPCRGGTRHDRVARTRLESEVLVKLKVDELLEHRFMPTDVRDDGGYGESAAT